MMTTTTKPATKPTRRHGPRGEYAKSETTRKVIIDAALEVFGRRGYGSGSLREVAQRVDMSEAGLLHHFPSKSALLQAALTYRDDLSREIVPMGADDGILTLHGLVALAAHNAHNPGVVELYSKLSAEATNQGHPAHTYFIDRYAWTRELISGAFTKLANDGRLVEGVDPMRASITTIALMDGLQVQWLLDRTVVDMAAALADFFRSLVTGFDTDTDPPEVLGPSSLITVPTRKEVPHETHTAS